MSDTSRQKLREIVATYGSAIVEDPRRLKALLKDLCGEAKLEISLLTLAAEQRIPSLLTLAEVWDPQDFNIHSLCDRLQSVQSMSMRSAIWTVRSWMYALGLADPSDESPLNHGLSSVNNGNVAIAPIAKLGKGKNAFRNGDHGASNGASISTIAALRDRLPTTGKTDEINWSFTEPDTNSGIDSGNDLFADVDTDQLASDSQANIASSSDRHNPNSPPSPALTTPNATAINDLEQDLERDLEQFTDRPRPDTQTQRSHPKAANPVDNGDKKSGAQESVAKKPHPKTPESCCRPMG
jgi:hypothetical protein